MTDHDLSAALARLEKTIAARAGADPKTSYTAQLLAAGIERCAKKLGEEGVEAALAAVSGDKDALANEAADLLYHLLVALQAAGVSTDAVAAALNKRDGVSGVDEKASRKDPQGG